MAQEYAKKKGKGLGVVRVLGLFTRGLRGMRQELGRIATAQEALLLLAQAQETRLLAAEAATPPVRELQEGDVEVTYVRDGEQQLWMQVQLDLTRATGQPPTEDEVYAEYMRRIPVWAAEQAEQEEAERVAIARGGRAAR